MPEKVKQMQALFYSEAKKYNVLPLDNSSLARWNTPRPSLTAGRTVFTYSGELTGVPASAAPSILDKSYTITAEVEIPDGGAEGMIVTEGGRFGGYGLFRSKGELAYGSQSVKEHIARACSSLGGQGGGQAARARGTGPISNVLDGMPFRHYSSRPGQPGTP